MESIELWKKESARLSKDFVSTQAKLRALILTMNESDILSEYKAIEKIYPDTVTMLKRKLDINKKSVNHLKDNISQYTDGNKIQKILETIESSLTSFKKMLYSESSRLLEEEIALSSELATETVQILAFASSNHGDDEEAVEAKSKFDRKQATERDISKNAMIGTIDRQLATLGRLGGWDYRDHDVFLKIWTQLGIEIQSLMQPEPGSEVNPDLISVLVPSPDSSENELKSETYIVTNRPTLERKLVKLLPGCTLQDIENHIEWYVKVTKLQEVKKVLLSEWKQVRQREVLGKIESELKLEIMGGSLSEGIGTKENETAQMIIEAEERRRTKERVEAWRKQRQEEEERKKREEEARIQQEQRRKEEAKRDRLESTRHQLRKWKEDDAMTKAKAESQMQQARRPASADPAEAMRRRQRNLEIGKERQIKINRRAEESKLRQTKQKAMEDEIINNIYSKIKRDPARLQTATRAVIAQQISKEYLDDVTEKRLSSSAHSRPIALSGRDLRLGVRAIPVWLKHH